MSARKPKILPKPQRGKYISVTIIVLKPVSHYLNKINGDFSTARYSSLTQNKYIRGYADIKDIVKCDFSEGSTMWVIEFLNEYSHVSHLIPLDAVDIRNGHLYSEEEILNSMNNVEESK